MKYEDLKPGDSIIDSNRDVWTLMTPRDTLGYATWMCMSDLHRVELCMVGEVPVHYRVCLASSEGT